MSKFKHLPVMFTETIAGLNLSAGKVAVDATLGGGGHAAEILRLVGDNGALYAFDQDVDAISNGQQRFATAKNVKLIHANFSDMVNQLAQLGVTAVDAILFDLGVSSHQLDIPQRGFTWREDAPLDMRMDQTIAVDAKQVLNDYSEADLATIIKEYGEERYAAQIAAAIVNSRQLGPLQSTGQLKDIVWKNVRGGYQQKTTSVARVFQAIRIEVNNELAILTQAMCNSVELLAMGGRLAVITFHSLEDRLVKNVFKQLVAQGTLVTVNKKVIKPLWEEVKKNSRSRSAKLRVVEKVAKQQD